MATARASHTLTVLEDGIALAVGGLGTDGQPTSAVEKYTPGTGACVASDGTPNAARYESWFGFDSLPKLQANNTEVRDLIWSGGPNSIARYWMQWADGWRLDVGGERVFVGLGQGGNALCILDAATGQELARRPVPYPVFSPPAVEGGQLIVGMGRGDYVRPVDDPAGDIDARGALEAAASLDALPDRSVAGPLAAAID